MFFVASKALSWVIDPIVWLLSPLLLAMWALHVKRVRIARFSVGIAAAVAIAVFFLPTDQILIRPLEQAFPRPGDVTPHVDGIITLAGALDPELTLAYGKPQLGSEAERVTEFVALARAHPQARLVFAGDGSAVRPAGMTEAEAMRQFLRGQQFDPARVIFESKSRNTHESAVLTHELLRPQPGETWLLVTSALHMKRAMGAFEMAGWSIVPYPVSYLAGPNFSMRAPHYGALSAALHEWVGIAAYRLTGRM